MKTALGDEFLKEFRVQQINWEVCRANKIMKFEFRRTKTDFEWKFSSLKFEKIKNSTRIEFKLQSFVDSQ